MTASIELTMSSDDSEQRETASSSVRRRRVVCNGGFLGFPVAASSKPSIRPTSLIISTNQTFRIRCQDQAIAPLEQRWMFDESIAKSPEILEYIQMDQREYTMDDEDRKVQDVILRPDPSNNDTMVLKKTLSCSYPNLPFNEALQKENEKLQLELQRSQANLDVVQCEVIQHLIDVTEVVAANSQSEKSSPRRNSKKMEPNYSDVNNDKEHSYDESCANKSASHSTLRKTSSVSSVSHWDGEWHSDLLGCCSEPLLCIKTFFCPCGTFSRIATVATNRHMSSAEACNELMAYSLILSCCCYTCCIRRKLRKMLNIKGGFVDDFLSHLMCCCCALVQEWREVEIRGAYGPEKTKTRPPPSQFMES